MDFDLFNVINGCPSFSYICNIPIKLVLVVTIFSLIKSGSVSLLLLYNLKQSLIEFKIPLVIHVVFCCL